MMKSVATSLITGACVCIGASSLVAQDRRKDNAAPNPQLTMYLQKDLTKSGISRRRDPVAGFYICSVDAARFEQTTLSLPVSALDAMVKHSTNSGRTPKGSATTDGKGGIAERFIIDLRLNDSKESPQFCEQMKSRFELVAPYTLHFAHDVKQRRLFVELERAQPVAEERGIAEQIAALGGEVTFNGDGQIGEVNLASVFGATFNDDDLHILTNLTALRSLSLGNLYRSVKGGKFRLTDRGLAHLAELKSLKVLKIGSDSVTDVGFKHLTKLSQLEWLIIRCPAMTDRSLEQLNHFKVLTALFLEDAHFTDDAIKRNVPRDLERLSLDGTKITDDVLTSVSSMNGLKLLSLSGTAVTDAGLAKLSGCVNLESLFLTDTAVSDQGLLHLHTLVRLRHVGLIDTKVSKNGVTKLHKALPKATVTTQ